MRTSLNEIKLIDDYLFNTAETGDRLVFDARLIIDDSLPEKVSLQKHTHTIIQQHSRRKLKAEIETVHQRLFGEPRHSSFAKRILNLLGEA